MKKKLELVLFFSAAILMSGFYSSCSDSDCSMMGRSMIYCNFYRINPDSKQVLRDTLSYLTVTALGSDSIVVNKEKNVSSVMLPLRYTSDTTSVVLHYSEENPMLRDTIRIVHNNTPFFESLECGYTMRQIVNNVSYTRQDVDSIYLQNKEANTNGTENLKIFYRYTD